MSEKRKPTTRYQGERPPKRRQLSPSPPPEPAIPKKLARKETVETPNGPTPVKSRDTQGLPIQSEKQDPNLSNEEYQSIAERSAAAASIQQSRHKWVIDGVFERYWTRPSKKKGQVDAPNPAKETMTRLGTCSMVIEPHVFETTLYTVKEYQSVFAPSQVPPPQPPNNPYNPYQNHKAYQSPVHTSYTQGTYPQYQQQYPPSSSNLTLPPFREGFGQFSPPAPPVGPPPYQNAAPPPRPVERSQSRDTVPQNDIDAAISESEKPTDPVIQMLATRAASDHHLKALMKVVASGHASQDQLREFQNHIDELNSLIKGQESSTKSTVSHHPPAPSQSHPYPNTPTPSSLSHPPPPSSSTTPYTPHPSAPTNTKPEPQPYPTHHYPPTPKPKPTPPLSSKPETTSIVFDFSPTGDRFFFPRFSILEFLPGNLQVLASFLILRKGSAAATPSDYNKTTTYYQPVTIRLSASNPKILEPLARVVAPPEEVRRYMEGVFDKMSPAKEAWLVVRAPRERVEEEEGEKKEAAEEDRRGVREVVRRVYEAPNSLVPLIA
ncbi:MAG: hypothetical protein Q9208_007828 [Pyrenodesmia sp. 3 TL-2023]